MKQFVLPFGAGPGTLRLTESDFHYLIRVRRCSAGDRIPALSRDGKMYEMEIISVARDSCSVTLHPADRDGAGESESDIVITLIPALTKGRKMDLTVRQAVEAGAGAIWPVITEHCQIKNDSENRKTRWERIALEALQQCGGSLPTVVAPPCTLKEIVERWNNRGLLLFLHERDMGNDVNGSLHRHLAVPVEELAIIVGPEGGLSPGETRLLLERGAHPVFLGSRILRAETAAIYGLAAVNTIIREKTEWQPV